MVPVADPGADSTFLGPHTHPCLATPVCRGKERKKRRAVSAGLVVVVVVVNFAASFPLFHTPFRGKGKEREKSCWKLAV